MIRVSEINSHNNFISYNEYLFTIKNIEHNNIKTVSDKFNDIFETNDDFFIACKYIDNVLKYNLLYGDGTTVFEDEWFLYISYDIEKNCFYFYYEENGFFKSKEIKLPIITQGKEIFAKIFIILLKKSNEKAKSINNIQILIDSIANKLQYLKDNKEKFSLVENSINFFYLIGCPFYLINNLILISEEDIGDFIQTILKRNNFEDFKTRIIEYSFIKNNKLFKEFDIDIKKEFKNLYDKNFAFFNNKFQKHKLYDINYVLNLPNLLSSDIKNSLKFRKNQDIFRSINSIYEYLNNKTIFRFIYKDELLSNNILLLNLTYNKNNKFIKDMII